MRVDKGGGVEKGLVTYTPQMVCIPADAAVERTFCGYELSKEKQVLYDRRTVFCDVFVAPNRKELVCVGPPFRNLGSPHTVRISGEDKRFVVEEPTWSLKRVSVVRVDIDASDVGTSPEAPVDLHVGFPELELDVTLTLGCPTPQAQVPLTLATMQKDNEPQWLQDWCTWHHRVHGVGRVILYDNGSEYGDEVYAELSRRLPSFELALVNWDFPYGPAEPFQLQFAQTVALNHCRLRFGQYTNWCINLDIDEYLWSTSSLSLESYLRSKGDPFVYLPSYIVPMAVDNKPRRCFDSSLRSSRLELVGGRKYIYRAKRTVFNEIHYVAAKKARGAALARRFVKGVLAACGVDPARVRAVVWRTLGMIKTVLKLGAQHQPVGDREPALFFFHFRALNTGWKYPRRIVEVDVNEHVEDNRIAAMKSTVDIG